MSKNIKTAMMFTIIFIFFAYGMLSADNEYQIGTRGEGIGFAFSALADEPFGALYNPAGQAFVRGLQTQVGYQIPTDYGLSTINESPYGAMLGFSFYSPGLGNVAINTHQYGSFSEPTLVTTLNSVNFSYSRSFTPQLGIGAGFKYMFETNLTERKVFDLDFGVTYKPVAAISLAAIGENLLRAKLTPDNAITNHLSRKFRLASAYHVRIADHNGSFLAGWQIEQSGEPDVNNTSLFNVGTEWWLGAYSDISLALRGGYTFGKTTILVFKEDYKRWSAGASLNFDIHGHDLRFDYAFRQYPFEIDESLTADHFVSVAYGWGGVPEYFADKPHDPYDLSKYRKENSWQAPATDEAKPKSALEIAEVPSGPQEIETEPAGTPSPPSDPQTVEYAKLNIELDATQLGGIGGSKVVFSLSPQGILYLSSWKLYIFSAKVKHWNEVTADDYALAVIRGKGVTPLSIIWDGTLSRGGLVQEGKYYFVVTAEDEYGTKYMSKWCNFKVK